MNNLVRKNSSTKRRRTGRSNAYGTVERCSNIHRYTHCLSAVYRDLPATVPVSTHTQLSVTCLEINGAPFHKREQTSVRNVPSVIYCGFSTTGFTLPVAASARARIRRKRC